MKIQDVNELSSEKFKEIFKNVIESTPQAAKSIVLQRPFENLNNLHLAFENYLENLSVEEKIALLKLHPDLAGKLFTENRLTAESTQEQIQAGLNRLTDEQKEQLIKLNAEYAEKFGFPFVICVRETNKIERILEGLHTRIQNNREDEINNGIDQVKKICLLRIDNIVKF